MVKLTSKFTPTNFINRHKAIGKVAIVDILVEFYKSSLKIFLFSKQWQIYKIRKMDKNDKITPFLISVKSLFSILI